MFVGRIDLIRCQTSQRPRYFRRRKTIFNNRFNCNTMAYLLQTKSYLWKHKLMMMIMKIIIIIMTYKSRVGKTIITIKEQYRSGIMDSVRCSIGTSFCNDMWSAFTAFDCNSIWFNNIFVVVPFNCWEHFQPVLLIRFSLLLFRGFIERNQSWLI